MKDLRLAAARLQPTHHERRRPTSRSTPTSPAAGERCTAVPLAGSAPAPSWSARSPSAPFAVVHPQSGGNGRRQSTAPPDVRTWRRRPGRQARSPTPASSRAGYTVDSVPAGWEVQGVNDLRPGHRAGGLPEQAARRLRGQAGRHARARSTRSHRPRDVKVDGGLRYRPRQPLQPRYADPLLHGRRRASGRHPAAAVPALVGRPAGRRSVPRVHVNANAESRVTADRAARTCHGSGCGEVRAQSTSSRVWSPSRGRARPAAHRPASVRSRLPRDSMNLLNRSRSPLVRCLTKPSLSPTCSTTPSGSTSSCSITRVWLSSSRWNVTTPACLRPARALPRNPLVRVLLGDLGIELLRPPATLVTQWVWVSSTWRISSTPSMNCGKSAELCPLVVGGPSRVRRRRSTARSCSLGPPWVRLGITHPYPRPTSDIPAKP